MKQNVATILIALGLITSAAGCSSYEGTDAETPDTVIVETQAPVTTPVVESGPTVIQLPASTVEIPVGALPSTATVTASEANLAESPLTGFVPAGPGVDVDTGSSTMSLPAVVTFQVGPQPAGFEAAALHIRDDGTWEVLPALYGNGQMVLATSDFSVQIPGWLNPVTAAEWLFSGATKLFGLRTSPPDCPARADWVGVPIMSISEVHACATTNSKGEQELVIRSNRSYWLQVNVPAPKLWVWVENMPAGFHAVAFGLDESRYLLPPGGTMTIGLQQPTAPIDYTVSVERNNLTHPLSVVSYLLGEWSNEAGAVTRYVGELFVLARCGLNNFVADDLSASIQAIVGCMVELFSQLDQAGASEQLAIDVFGDIAASDRALSDKLDALANKFKGLGKVASVLGTAVSVLGLVDQLADEIFAAFSSTAPTIAVRLTPPALPEQAAPTSPATPAPTPAPVTVAPPAPGTQSLSIQFHENPYRCDGGTRVFATVSGLQPGEPVTFSSPQVPGLTPGTGDGNGNQKLIWYCSPEEAGLAWTITATGSWSGRSVTFDVVGG